MEKMYMQYKDLIYKITSSKIDVIDDQEKMKKDSPDLNDAKKALQLKDVLIGVMINSNTVLDKDISNALKVHVERTLTVLFNSPISDTFSFLPYDKNTLTLMLDLFPDKKHHYLSTNDETEQTKLLKSSKLNLTMVYNTNNRNDDFVNKIDYLVTVNVDPLETTMQAKLKEKNVMIMPLTFRGIENFSQKEKLVVPDSSGWVYNSANGIWSKNWGNDGSATIKSWKADDDWGLS